MYFKKSLPKMDSYHWFCRFRKTIPDMIETAQVLQQQFKEIGILAEINQLEWGTYVNAWKSKDMTLLVGRNDPDRRTYGITATRNMTSLFKHNASKFTMIEIVGLRKEHLDRPRLIIADEPVSALGVSIQAQIRNIPIRKLCCLRAPVPDPEPVRERIYWERTCRFLPLEAGEPMEPIANLTTEKQNEQSIRLNEMRIYADIS